MCVIALSRKRKPVPSKTDLKHMWDKNPDGAGILVELGDGRVKYTKGLMTWEAFEAKLDEYSAELDLQELSCAFHFRIKTHGITNAETTHPFILSPRYEDLRVLEYEGTTPVMMHNGTMSSFGGMLDTKSSDTQDFAGTIGYRMLRLHKGKKPGKTIIKVVKKNIDSSRIVVFYGDGEPITLGSWSEYSGYEVSNTFFKPYESVYTPSYSQRYIKSGANTLSSFQQDEFGRFINVYPVSGREWIQFSDKSKMETNFHSYEKEIDKDGKQWYIPSVNSYNKSKYQIIASINEDGDEVYNTVTEKGKEDFDTFEVNVVELAYEGIFFGSRDELLESALIHDGRYYNDLGQEIYYDSEAEIGHTEDSLKYEYGDKWRIARKDILANGKITKDWSMADDEDIKKFNMEMKELYSENHA